MQEATAQGKPTVPPAKEERRISRRKLLGNASVVGLGLAGAALGGAFAYDKLSGGPTERTTGLLRENVTTSFNPTLESPVIAEGAYIDRFASVIGNVIISNQVYVAPFASIRGD